MLNQFIDVLLVDFGGCVDVGGGGGDFGGNSVFNHNR